VLWPLFHYLIGQVPLEVQGLELYETVNRRFADAVVANYQHARETAACERRPTREWYVQKKNRCARPESVRAPSGGTSIN